MGWQRRLFLACKKRAQAGCSGTRETDLCESKSSQGYILFQDSQGCIMRCSLEKKTKEKERERKKERIVY